MVRRAAEVVLEVVDRVVAGLEAWPGTAPRCRAPSSRRAWRRLRRWWRSGSAWRRAARRSLRVMSSCRMLRRSGVGLLGRRLLRIVGELRVVDLVDLGALDGWPLTVATTPSCGRLVAAGKEDGGRRATAEEREAGMISAWEKGFLGRMRRCLCTFQFTGTGLQHVSASRGSRRGRAFCGRAFSETFNRR